MNPILQTKFDKDGNCLAACIATIYSVDIDSIPSLSDHIWDKEISEWFAKQFNKFIIPMRLHDLEDSVFNGSFVLTVINSENPNIERHAVITQGNKIVFDPMLGVIDKELKQESDPVFLVIGDLINE